VRFQVLTESSMNMTAFWDTVPCSLVEVGRRFRGAYWLHHQGDESSPWLWKQYVLDVCFAQSFRDLGAEIIVVICVFFSVNTWIITLLVEIRINEVNLKRVSYVLIKYHWVDVDSCPAGSLVCIQCVHQNINTLNIVNAFDFIAVCVSLLRTSVILYIHTSC
jgi:hypothetical protein